MIQIILARTLLVCLAAGIVWGIVSTVGTFAGLLWADKRMSRKEARGLDKPVMMIVVGSGRGWEPYRRRK